LKLEDQQECDQEHQSNDLEKDDTRKSAEEEEEEACEGRDLKLEA
jgi:hypothetical protein